MTSTARAQLIAAVVLLLLAACESSPAPADLLVVGPVWTGDLDQPTAEAVAIRDGRIAAVGAGNDLENLIGPETRIVDSGVGMVVPGFIDSHVHFLDGGANLASVQLRDAATPEEFTRRIGEFAATRPAGEWILGGDWDHMNWGGELPTHEWIDATTPDHPVFVTRLDGHMSLANSAALRAAGIDRNTPDVEGGEIVRGADGEPTGVLKDNAMNAVFAAVPEPTAEQQDAMLTAAMAYAAEHGITTVHHMAYAFDDLSVFERARERGSLITRIRSCAPLAEWSRLADHIASAGRGDTWVGIGCLKGFVDGSLGSHTAAFLEPFDDAPGDRGLFVTPPELLREQIAAADAAGLQIDIHAIGDRAIRALLDLFEQVGDEHGDRDRRFRMEHAQHIDAADIARFGELGVIASMQPYHAIDDGRWAERIIGRERARTTYAFRSLLDAGARLAFGSDWPVAPADPIVGIYAAVTRRTLDDANPDGWVPEQKITLQEALRAWTLDAAYATYDATELGSIEVGKHADLAVLDRDLRELAPERLREASVRMTIVGGQVVYERERP